MIMQKPFFACMLFLSVSVEAATYSCEATRESYLDPEHVFAGEGVSRFYFVDEELGFRPGTSNDFIGECYMKSPTLLYCSRTNGFFLTRIIVNTRSNEFIYIFEDQVKSAIFSDSGACSNS